MASPGTAMGAVPEDPGVGILDPGAGTTRVQRRSERPAQVGRYGFAVLGAVTAGAAAGLWFFHPSPVGAGLLAFGAVMLVLAVVQHRLLLRERAHWPEQAILWTEGVEIVLRNGEIRVASWSDPRFALDAYVRPGKTGGSDEVMLRWSMDRRLPLCPITPDGLDRLRTAIDAHGLRSLEYRGGGRRAMRAFEFRAPPPSPPAKRLASDPGRAPH